MKETLYDKKIITTYLDFIEIHKKFKYIILKMFSCKRKVLRARIVKTTLYKLFVNNKFVNKLFVINYL